MTLTASCGHQVEDIDALFDLQLKDHNEFGNPCVTYGAYCETCANLYLSEDKVIQTKDQESAWLSQEYSHNILDLAQKLVYHKDSDVSLLANLVLQQLKKVTIKIDTNHEFTLALGDHATITGIGKLEYESIDSAIYALENATIASVRPIRAYTPDGFYEITDNDTQEYSFFIRWCVDAANAIKQGTDFKQSNGIITISVTR